MGIRAPVLLSMLLLAVILLVVFLSAGSDPRAGAPSRSAVGPDLSVPDAPSPNAGGGSLPDARIFVRGVVVDDEGRPLRGAEVLVSAEGGESETLATTDTRGAFSVRVPAGTRALRFRKSGRVPVGVCLDPADAGDLRVRLRRGVTLRGIVLDGPDREPVAGARVRVQCWQLDSLVTLSDEDGRFAVSGLPPGKSVDVDVDAGPHGWSELYEIIPSRDGELEVLLPRAFTLSGRVRDQTTGEPVPGVAVSAWAGVGHSYIGGPCVDGVRRQNEPAISGADGGFRIPGVVRRAFLRVESGAWFLPGEEPSFRDGDDPVEVFVTRRSVVSGTVSAPDGSAVAGAEVRADGRTTTADAGGRFSLRGVGLRGDGTEVRAVSPGPGVQLSGSVQLRYAYPREPGTCASFSGRSSSRTEPSAPSGERGSGRGTSAPARRRYREASSWLAGDRP